MSGDAEQEYFADGMVEEITTALSRVRSLFVIARNSAFTYKGRAVDIKQVGRELGVRYVLEGSVRKSGTRVRITGQLIEAASGTHIWADRFDGTLDDVFDLQDRVTASVVAAIAPRVRAAEIQRAQRAPAGNPQAYDLYLRSQPVSYTFAREEAQEAIRLLRQAVAIDPAYALAYAQLASVSWNMVAQNWIMRDDPLVADMVALARKALALDGDDPEVISAAALVIALPGGDLDGAISMGEKAVRLNPNSAMAFRRLGVLYSYRGDLVEAIAAAEQADRLNPLDGIIITNLAQVVAHFVLGQHEEAADWATKGLRQRESAAPLLRYGAASLGLLGRLAEAREMVARLLLVTPGYTIARARRHIEFDMNNVFKKPGVADAFYEGLRRAGVPEG